METVQDIESRDIVTTGDYTGKHELLTRRIAILTVTANSPPSKVSTHGRQLSRA